MDVKLSDEKRHKLEGMRQKPNSTISMHYKQKLNVGFYTTPRFQYTRSKI